MNPKEAQLGPPLSRALIVVIALISMRPDPQACQLRLLDGGFIVPCLGLRVGVSQPPRAACTARAAAGRVRSTKCRRRSMRSG